MASRTRGRTARALRIGAAAVAAGLAAPALATAAPSWLAPATLSAADTAAAPQVAVDAAGDAVVAYSDNAGVVRAASRAAGAMATWGSPAALGAGASPRLATDLSGRAVVVYRDASGTVSAVTRDSASGSWSSPLAITSSPVAAGVVLRVAMDGSGDAVAVWNTSATTIEGAVRPAGGAWGAAETLCTSCDKPALAVDAGGNALAAWVRSGRGESRIRPAAPGFVSAWGAADWATPSNVTPIQPQLAMDARGTTVMVFRDVSGVIESIARPGSGGHFSTSQAWTAPQVISVPGENVDQPQVAMDAAGDAVAVWRHTSSPATVQAASRAADDPWAGWGAPQNLLVNAFPVANPQVSINAAGDAAIVWEQGTATSIQATVRPASAGPSGAFPAARELASGAVAEIGPAVATDPAGNALAAWREDDASSSAVRAAGFDATGPVVTGFTGPASGTVGATLPFTHGTDDVWSPLGAAASWDFGDGGTAGGAAVSHAFSAAGTYTVTVSRSDVLGNATVSTRSVTISAPPAAAPPPSAPPSSPAPAEPAPISPPPSVTPTPVALTKLALRRLGTSWTAQFRLATRSVVRGRLVRGRTVRVLAPRTRAAGTARQLLGRLAPGTYRLTLTATAGGRAATAARTFTVR